MPFTGSHPAAVLPLLGLPAFGAPLAGLRLVPAGLVAGSMAPDLPLFVPLPVTPASTHTPWGILGVDALLAVGMALGWRAAVQPVLVAAAPAGVRARLGPASPPSARSLLSPGGLAALALSGAAGAATHLGWDAFTHDDRWGTRRTRWLRTDHGALPGYAWAQYGSGVFGLAVLGAWSLRWYKVTPPSPEPPSVAPLPPWVAGGIAAAVVGASLAAGFGSARQAIRHHQWADAGFLGATRGGAAAAVAVLVAGAAHRASRVIRADRAQPISVDTDRPGRVDRKEEAPWPPG